MTWTTIKVLANSDSTSKNFVQEFWLFGGKGYPLPAEDGMVNDLWKLSVPVVDESMSATELVALFQSLKWERISDNTKGDYVVDDPGVYGVYPEGSGSADSFSTAAPTGGKATGEAGTVRSLLTNHVHCAVYLPARLGLWRTSAVDVFFFVTTFVFTILVFLRILCSDSGQVRGRAELRGHTTTISGCLGDWDLADPHLGTTIGLMLRGTTGT